MRTTERPERDAFAAILRDAGFVTTIRYSLGADIAAACGQLVQSENREIARRSSRHTPCAVAAKRRVAGVERSEPPAQSSHSFTGAGAWGTQYILGRCPRHPVCSHPNPPRDDCH